MGGGVPPSSTDKRRWLTGTVQLSRTRAFLEQMPHQLCRQKQASGHPRVWGSRGQDVVGGPASQRATRPGHSAMNISITRQGGSHLSGFLRYFPPYRHSSYRTPAHKSPTDATLLSLVAKEREREKLGSQLDMETGGNHVRLGEKHQ